MFSGFPKISKACVKNLSSSYVHFPLTAFKLDISNNLFNNKIKDDKFVNRFLKDLSCKKLLSVNHYLLRLAFSKKQVYHQKSIFGFIFVLSKG